MLEFQASPKILTVMGRFGFDKDGFEQIAVGAGVTAAVFLLLVGMGECVSKGWC